MEPALYLLLGSSGVAYSYRTLDTVNRLVLYGKSPRKIHMNRETNGYSIGCF
jgi:hypothetical protein